MTLINDKWSLIFRDMDIMGNIQKEGEVRILAKDINKYKEARLMTKFDNKEALPQIFVDNNLSILPDTRGSYII